MSEVKTDKISSVSTNGDITLDPDGTGKVSVSGALHIDSGSDNANTLLLSDGAADNNIVDGFVTCRHHSSSEEPVHMIQGRATSTENIVLIGGTHNNTTYNTATSVKFFTAANSTTTTPSERMRISSDGKIRLANTAMNFDSSSNTATGLTTGTNGLTHICTGSGNAQIVCQKVSPSGDENMIFFLRGSTGAGQIRTNSSNEVLYQSNSDHRLKENVSDMTGAIARVKQLTPKRFSYISDPDSTIVDGFLAHEAQTVVPNAISGTHNEVDDDGNAVMQGIDQSKLVPLLTGALKEAVAKIEALEARVTALEDA